MNDFTRTMAPETAVKKAHEALDDLLDGVDDAGAVATLAAAMLINEGLNAVAKTISASDDKQEAG